MDETGRMETYLIRQKKEWTEIFTGFETRNRYVVCDTSGRELYFAAEVGTSFLARNLLKAMRGWTIQVIDPGGAEVLRITRPFRLYFHKADIFDSGGNMLGTIQRRWSWLRRIYSVLDGEGSERFQLFGPILHPWTFRIRRNGADVGKIVKKWSGLAKEAFTKADNFAVTFPESLDTPLKSLLLGAVFLIDFVHFEKSSSGGA